MTTQVADLVARLRADSSGFVAGITQAVTATDRAEVNLRKFGTSASQVGSSLTRSLTLPIVAAAAASIKLSTDFQTSFGKIAAATHQPLAAMRDLQDQTLKLAQSTATSPTKLAESLLLIEKSGTPAAQAMNVLSVAAKASAVGLGDTKAVADAVTSAMNAYGPANLSAAAAGDILAKASVIGKASIEDLNSSLGRTLPVAAAAGVSFSDLAAAEAVMTREGLTAGQAGMSLFRILSSIENPTSKGAKALAQMGISVQDAQKAIASGDLLGLLQKIASASAGNAGALITLAGGVRGASGAFALLANDGESARKAFNQVKDSSGELNRQLGVVAGTTGFQLRQALADIEVALIKFGDVAAPGIKVVAGGIRDLANFIGGLPGPVKEVVIGFGLLVAVAGPLLTITGSLIRNGIALRDMMSAIAAWAAKDATANEAATVATQTRTVAEAELNAVLAERAGASTLGALNGIGPTAAGGGAATAGLVETEAASAGLIGTLGGLALVFGTVAVAAKLFDTNLGVGPVEKMNRDVKDLTHSISDFQHLPTPEQDKVFKGLDASIDSSVQHLKDLQRAMNAGSFKSLGSDPNAVGVEPHVDLSQPTLHLEALHKALLGVINDQGAIAARPFWERFLSETARIPGAATIIGNQFDDIKAKFAAADAAIRSKAADWGSAVGVGGAKAAAAVASYDAAMGTASTATEATRDAGRQAAVALAGIGVAAHFAAEATVEGMTAAETAVSALAASIQQGMELSSQSDSLASSLDALGKAQKSVGSGGGGGGMTALGQQLDQAQKELAVRDAQRAIATTATAVTSAELQLTQAKESSRLASQQLTTAEKEYSEALNGVAANSLKAREAVLAYQQAKNDKAGSQLDVRAAQRSLAQAKNDKGLYDIAVREARQKLADDRNGTAGSTQQWVQTATGSKQVSSGGSGPASADQIRKDQIALNDALIAAGGANDSVTRAQLALSNAEIAGKQKTIDLNAAHKTLNGTLHGYAAGSKEAKQATDDLAAAILNSQQAALGSITAAQGLVTAQDAVATSALNLQRAIADKNGALTVAGGAMETLATHALAVKQATHDVEKNLVGMATALADKQFNSKSQPIQWAEAFYTGLKNLRDFLHPSGELSQFLDDTLAKYNQIFHPAASTPVTLPTKQDLVNGNQGLGLNLAIGGPVLGNDPTGIPIMAHPNEYVIQAKAVQKYGKHMMDMLNAGALPKFAAGGIVGPSIGGNRISGGGSSGSGPSIHYHYTQLIVQALDPSTAGPVVVKALRSEYVAGGPISGVAFVS